ncbi:MAG: tetratricopeptide repeat protein [Phycisphaerae bacterium]|nr:tetratricopeptide repeat protein [Phycisphaerae bacterium]
MAEDSPRKSKATRSFSRHRLPLILLAVVVLAGGVAVYITMLPQAPPKTDAEPMTESQKVRMDALELLRSNQPDTAVDLLKQYLSTHARDVAVWNTLAELYLRTGRPDECDATIRESLAIAPDNAEALWLRGMSKQARGEDPSGLFRQAARTPDASAEVLGMYGLFLLQEEKGKEAQEYLRRAMEGGTKNGLVYAALGQIAFGRNQIDEAERLLKRAVELTPQSVPAWAILAEVQKNRGETDPAIASLQNALKYASGPQRGAVLMELGRTRMTGEHWDQAAEMFSQAAEYPVAAPRAAYLAAQCYYFTDAYGKAMHYIDKAAALLPDDSGVKQWKQKIETARFGKPAKPKPAVHSLLDVPPEEKTKAETKTEKEEEKK